MCLPYKPTYLSTTWYLKKQQQHKTKHQSLYQKNCIWVWGAEILLG